jgi:hypothetical protein
MIFSYDDKICSGDLSSDYTEQLVEITKSRILDNSDLMGLITEYAKNEYEECKEFGGKLTVEDYKELKIYDLAMEAISRARFYIEFDVDASEADL